MNEPDEPGASVTAGAPHTPWQRRPFAVRLERLPIPVHPLLALVFTLAAVSVALWVRMFADHALPPGYPFISFYPAVIGVSVLVGPRYGAVTATLCGLAGWYYFIPPAFAFPLDPGALTAVAFYAFVVGTDVVIVHWMLRANQHLAAERERSAALARVRALLFDELQHRVSNNLQAVAALLSLQRRRLDDPQAAAALTEASQRVALVGRISRRLYDSDGSGQRLASFLAALLDDVIEANGRDDIEHAVRCPHDITLGSEQALAVALVVAESIANAIEHGLAGHRAPQLAVEVTRNGSALIIAVIDNGGTLPAEFSLENSDSLGLSIARMLARQCGGRFELSGGPTTRASLHLPAF